MSKHSSRLTRLGVLAPAALSVCMDASVLAVPAAGAIVSTVLKELSKAFMLKKWFHGTMSAKEAEHLMMERGKNGSFLVRESLTRPGELVLSVRVRGRVTHVMIRRQHNKYDVGSGEQFDDLVGLIEHFRSYPMVETSGDVLRLLQPVKARRENNQQDTQIAEENIDTGSEGDNPSEKALEERLGFTTHEGMKPANISKNRYRNILPYDQTRVVLRQLEGMEGSDYINANYIRSSRLHDSPFQSSNESIGSVKSLIIRNESQKHAPLVTKSLSDDAFRNIKSSIKPDKINGNLFQNKVKEKLYIATQGCLSSTVHDFWRMIWQEDARIIVMIANVVEKGKRKCEQYWPVVGEEEEYSNLFVKGVSEKCYEDYTVREFDVTDDKHCYRTIYHYQFVTWPDHSTPESSEGVLAFVDDINRRLDQIGQSMNPPEQNTICVHCSAGVGRTGTFIALDMLIDKIKYAGENCDIDVQSTVRLVRAQRGGMVQTRAQYKFLKMALRGYIENNNLIVRKKVYTSDA